MFQGETAITIDDKGRLAIPVAFRDVVARECGNRLVLTYNPFDQGSLYLYPEAGWQAVRDQIVALSRRLPPVWFARALAAWPGIDRNFCVSLLDPAVALEVKQELVRMGTLSPKVADAIKAEVVVLLSSQEAA